MQGRNSIRDLFLKGAQTNWNLSLMLLTTVWGRGCTVLYTREETLWLYQEDWNIIISATDSPNKYLSYCINGRGKLLYLHQKILDFKNFSSMMQMLLTSIDWISFKFKYQIMTVQLLITRQLIAWMKTSKEDVCLSWRSTKRKEEQVQIDLLSLTMTTRHCTTILGFSHLWFKKSSKKNDNK